MKYGWHDQSKSTQTRDNRIYSTSLRLLFSTISYAPINVDAFVECSMWEIFRLFPSCHKGSSLSVLIQSYIIIADYFCNPQKASVGMYSRSCHPYFILQFLLNCFLYLFLFFCCTWYNLSVPSYHNFCRV